MARYDRLTWQGCQATFAGKSGVFMANDLLDLLAEVPEAHGKATVFSAGT